MVAPGEYHLTTSSASFEALTDELEKLKKRKNAPEETQKRIDFIQSLTDTIKLKIAIDFIEEYGLQAYANAMTGADKKFEDFFNAATSKYIDFFGKEGGLSLRDVALIQKKFNELTNRQTP